MREMYCPKCKQSFEAASRRFCPTDGSRLVMEAGPETEGHKGGIFANLIPQMEGIRDLGDTMSDEPRLNLPSLGQASAPINSAAKGEDEIFFEFEDLEPDFIAEREFSETVNVMPATAKPAARKVNPYEIPAGHVDLDDATRASAFNIDFNADDPGGFLGRTVKGRYKVTQFLGGDETGLAYVADDKIVEDKKVLVRILIQEEDDEMIRNILAEERISLSHFSHPNIARLIDSGQFTGGTQFLVSEYVDALSVRDILDIHGQFGAARTARVIRQAANALNEAHQEGILHRDLRPSSLILNPCEDDAEQTMVVNFGASNGDPTPDNVAYKAPEVLEGRLPSTASDIFSLGVTAYEMLNNIPPFAGKTAKELLRSQSEGFDTREFAPAVATVLGRALAHSPGERYIKAREFGDAFYEALAEAPQPVEVKAAQQTAWQVLSPAVPDRPIRETAVPVIPPKGALPAADEPAWTRRSSEPPVVGTSRTRKVAAIGITGLVLLLVSGWIYLMNNPSEGPLAANDANTRSNAASQNSINTGIEVPPPPRSIPQPPNTNFYQNSKQNLKGDLLVNFVGFTMYYPRDWKVNGPQPGANVNTRGKFIDISRLDDAGRMKEQMLISYYQSKGTFGDDASKFPELVKETNETLKRLLPGYQMVSEGEIKFNGDWRAYEVKFQGGGTSPTGEKLIVWGRRLFIPAARPGVRNGFEITMVATSYADEVRSVDDVGVRGELAAILQSFEPSQNF